MTNSQQDDKPEKQSGQTINGDQFNFHGGTQKWVFGSHGVYNEGTQSLTEVKLGPKVSAPSATDAPWTESGWSSIRSARVSTRER